MIVTSLLDTDLYKFTMQQVVWQRFPTARVEYAFRCRRPDPRLAECADEVRAQIDALGELRLDASELAFLRSIRYLQPEFVDALRGFRLDPALVRVEGGAELSIRVAGSWFETILFEVPILSIVNEVYFRRLAPLEQVRAEGERRLSEKIARAAGADVALRIMEFGTRRRFSGAWQRHVVGRLKEGLGERLVGTSNVLLARDLALRPFGTMAHEFLQAGQAMVHLADSQRHMFDVWNQVYRGDLGIALSDIFGTDAFLADFDRLLAKAYDGARHDSGDPVVWGERLIAHYEALGIDPRTRNAVFSDGLDIDTAIALARRFEGRIRTTFGIGTHLTNDLGIDALPIVLKMVRCNGRPVVKLSDAPGKEVCEDPVFLAYARSLFPARG